MDINDKSKNLAKLISVVIFTALILIANSVAAKSKTVSSLSKVSGVSSKQVMLLKKSGISSVAKLSKAKAKTVAKILRVSPITADKMIAAAGVQRSKLNRTYRTAKSKFYLDPKIRAVVRGNSYASLIAPTNECTILVRKVCGTENQCATSMSCPIAMQVLELYNSESDKSSVAESCIIALEDGVIFNACGS